MFGFERSSLESAEKQIKLTSSYIDNNNESSDPIEIAKQELYEEIQSLQEQAEITARKPTPENIQTFTSELKTAQVEISTANIREYGYNPPKEMVELHAKVEHHYNQMIRNQISCSSRYQNVMNKLNELLSIVATKDELEPEDKIKVEKLINELNDSNLEMPSSHPGILSNNEKPGFNIKFSTTDVVEVIKREANRFYSMCESAIHQLFIFIQKLFNDLLSIFDTSKASLRNDPTRKIVDNQIPR